MQVKYRLLKKGAVNLLAQLQQSPIAVIWAADELFMYYSGGIYQPVECGSMEQPNHSFLVFGYDLEAPVPYLLAKNGWGKDWGEDGYVKIAITDKQDMCMIHSTPFNTAVYFI